MINNHEELFKNAVIFDCSRILLRRFTLDDCMDVYEYASNPETVEHLRWIGVRSIEETVSAIKDYYMITDGVYAIELKSEKKCIGTIDLRPNWPHEKMSFGYVLNKKYWGKGYMTEVLTKLVQFCFNDLEMNRVESHHYLDNPASGRVMSKSGLKYEGTAPQQEKIKGIFRDVVHYGITLSQWREAAQR